MDLVLQLDPSDLADIEGDLSLYEKVAVSFLLCQDQLEADFFLQQLSLLVTMQDPNHNSNMILEWSRRHQPTDWTGLLIECLTVAQCNHVLSRLGLSLDKLRLFYYPNIAEITTQIRPVIKLLFLMSERLSCEESSELILQIRQRHTNELSSLSIDQPGLLEIHLLHFMSQRIIKVFDKQDPPQLSALIDHFKAVDNLDLYDFLKSNLDRIAANRNKSTASQLTRDVDAGAGGSRTLSQVLPTSISQREDDTQSYSMNRNSPGTLLIINQFKFHRESDPDLSFLLPTHPLDERKGTEKDVEALKRSFLKFNYTIIVRDDLKHCDILAEIKRVCDSMKRTDCSLFVAILSHGIEGCVYGSNSIPLEVKEIKNHIFNCADHMLGRPKCLIVQACQGDTLQILRVVTDDNLQTDSPNPKGRPVAIPPCSDFLIAWSTVEGFASVRHILNGTWFVQTFCKMIEEHHERTHLLDILTMVNDKIASMKGNRNESMIPKIESTFRKKFFFPQ